MGLKLKDRRFGYLWSALGACALTFFVLLTVFTAFELYPFGGKSVSWCDMNQQVVPLLCDFKDILAGKGSMLLNMQNAGGMDFWGVFFFFLASPFSLLVAFVDKADMRLFVNILVLLKLLTASVTASVFFRRVFPKLTQSASWALSVAYALCGFGLMYYQNVIWLDMLWSFPLLLLSMLRLAEKKKPLCFILMLSLSVVMNYYIGYMLVVFLLLAAALWLFFCTTKEERGKLSLLFLLSCAVAALLTAVVWLPSLLEYFSSARGGTGLLSSLASGGIVGHYETKNQLLFCTPMIFAVLPFLSFKTAPDKKRLSFALTLFLLMLFASLLEPINRMWQTGNYQSFPLRYGYMIVFFGLILAANVLSRGEDDNRFCGRPGPVIASAVGVFTVYFIGRMLLRDEKDALTSFTRTLWGDEKSFRLLLLWFIPAFFVFTWLYQFAKDAKMSKRLLSVFVCLLVTVTSVFNTSVYIGSAASEDVAYREEADLAGRIEDNSFYRVKSQKKYFVVNGLGGFGYNSLAHYTSLTDQNYMFAMKKLGYSSYWMEVNSNGGTILSDAILRNRYTVSKDDSFAYSDDAVYENNSYSLLKSAFDLPAAVKLSADPALYEAITDGERCEVQDALYRLYTGKDDSVITRYEVGLASGVDLVRSANDGLYYFTLTGNTSGRIRYEIHVNGKQALYFDAFKDISNRLKEALYETFTVSVNGRTVDQNYPNQYSNGILPLGEFEDEDVIVTVTVKKNAVAASYGVFGVDKEKVDALCESAEGCDIKVNGNRITAGVEGCKGEYLYICLPYLDGYRAAVNGKEVALSRVNDAFLALPLTDGENDIVLTYLPRGFTVGLLLTLLSLPLGFVFLLLLKKREGLFDSPAAGAVGTCLVYAAGIVVFLAVYLFPTIVFVLQPA